MISVNDSPCTFKSMRIVPLKECKESHCLPLSGSRFEALTFAEDPLYIWDSWTMGMTSKANHGDSFNGYGVSKPIHFFRIMYPETLLQGKLRIPGKFVRKYGKCLSNTMFLKLPNGEEWKVSVEKHDGGVWIHKGWKEFVEYYSIAIGHLLVFRYDGTTSLFHVLICGLSTMEIDYPFNEVDCKRVTNSELQPHKICRTNENNKDESNTFLQDCKVSFPLTGMLENQSEEKKNIDQHTKRSSISDCGEAAANTSFMVIMKSHHLKQFVHLPKGSLQGYIKPGAQIVTLLTGDKSWRVKLIHYPNNPSSTIISAGWLTFARENNLEVGDACLFELLNSNDDIMMKVFIYKRSYVKS